MKSTTSNGKRAGHVSKVRERTGRAFFLGLMLSLAFSGCASRPPSDDRQAVASFQAANDPLEPTNRKIFGFNMYLDRNVLKPVAKGYRSGVPEPARNSVRNFFDNLHSPVTLVNSLLQGDMRRTQITFARLVMNTTLGFGGIFDPATDASLPRYEEDFGQTLGVWGVGEGPYLMLPLLGPKPPRDAAGFVVDTFTDPTTYIFWNSSFLIPLGLTAVDLTDVRSRNIETLDEIERTSIDFYAALRSLYRQHRNSQIRNGQVTVEQTPTYSPSDFEFEDNPGAPAAP